MGRRKKKQKQNKTHTQKKGSDIRGRARSSRGPRYKEKQTRIQKERPHYLDQESNHSPQKQTNINWTNRVTSPRARSSLRTKQEEEKRQNTHTNKRKRKKKPHKEGKMQQQTNTQITALRSRTRRVAPATDHPFSPSHAAFGGGKPGDGPARLALCLCLYVPRSLVATPDVRRART